MPTTTVGDHVTNDDAGDDDDTNAISNYSKDEDTLLDTVNTLTTRHRGGFSLSTLTFSFSSSLSSSSFMPIFFQIYIIQLYAFVLQFVKLGTGASEEAGI